MTAKIFYFLFAVAASLSGLALVSGHPVPGPHHKLISTAPGMGRSVHIPPHHKSTNLNDTFPGIKRKLFKPHHQPLTTNDTVPGVKRKLFKPHHQPLTTNDTIPVVKRKLFKPHHQPLTTNGTIPVVKRKLFKPHLQPLTTNDTIPGIGRSVHKPKPHHKPDGTVREIAPYFHIKRQDPSNSIIPQPTTTFL